ncbi:MAG: Ig-like domain-containing protein [Candidatus Edwardsbacteria bacterium]|nr:Ig-like domain-containing protein [Candidatus Edwardsbacteria bacterium]
MKRTFIVTAVCLLTLAGLLLQCGKKSNPIPPPPPTPTVPTVTSAYPANGTAGLARNTLIYIVFSEAMDHAATEGALSVTGMTGIMSWSNHILIFRPDSLFGAGDSVTFAVSTAAVDAEGTAMAAAVGYSFVCGAAADLTPPSVASHSPAGTGVALNTEVTAHCSEKLAPWSDGAISLRDSASGAAVGGATGISNDSILRFVPAALAPSRTYLATVGTACLDRCGNPMAADHSWYFTTAADNVPPTVNGTSPADGDTLVPVNAQVRIRFSEPMDTAATRAATTHSPTLHYRATWSDDTLMTLTMTDTLSFHTAHRVTVGTGAMDRAGNHLASAHQFIFTTARGLYVACQSANETHLYQAHDLKPEGYLPFTSGITSVRMSTDGNIAYLLTSSGLRFRQVHDHNSEPLATNLSGDCYGMAVSPNGARLAVSDTAAMHNYVYLINAVNGQIQDTFAAGGAAPKGMAFSADSRYLYVLCQFNNRLEVYDLDNPGLAPAVVWVPNGGEELAITPAGDRVYAACGSEVSVIRTSDNTALTPISGVSSHPFGLAVSPDGQHLAVACYNEGGVKVYKVSDHSLVATVATGTRPKGLCYSPDGAYLYVANSGSGTVTPVARSGATYTPGAPITVGAGPWGVAVTP